MPGSSARPCSLLALVAMLAGACSDAPPEPRQVNGVVGQLLTAVDRDGQTVAHMELTGLLFLPGDRGLLVWEKVGRIAHYVLEADQLVLQGEVRLEDVYSTNDCGLVSLALDPDWKENGFLFAGHCTSKFYSAVTRYEFHGGDYDRVAGTASPVIEFGDPHAIRPWHNVGTIGFFDDAEHSMWVLAGEKQNKENAQDHSTNLGAILRIIPNREPDGEGYEPHPDNPFGGPGADPDNSSSPDLYAWGLRSPWRGAIDDRGRIWIGDVGDDNEEINLASAPGQNFAWPDADGPCRGEDACTRTRDPLTYWAHGSNHRYRKQDRDASATTKRVVWVGVPYRSDGPDVYEGFLDGAILAGDMCVGWIRALAAGDDDSRLTRDAPAGHLTGVSGMAQGPDGFLYVTSYGTCTSASHGFGGIYRLQPRFNVDQPEIESPVPSAPLVDEPLGPMPLQLSEAGIFADEELKKPIARAIPYEPSLPLWSNGSEKERWLLLPDGAQIDNADRDSWEFPPGTLFFKTFSYTHPDDDDADEEVTTRIETRVIRRTEAGWEYHAYMWRGGDAELLSLEQGVEVKVADADGDEFKHEIPSRFDCQSCHESNDTAIIGFDELRLNAPRADADATQLEELDAAGVFTEAVPSDPDAVDEPDEQSADVAGYLHGNCAHCHNGSDRTMSVLSLEHDVALANVIGMEVEGSGQAAGIRVVPGSPEASRLFQAFSGETDDDEVQPMPPVGVARIDEDAVELLREWIAGLPQP